MKQIKIGDVVRLRSGGPEMTVDRIVEDKNEITAACVWHDGKDLRFTRLPVSAFDIVRSDNI